jgi:hypothetical protein
MKSKSLLLIFTIALFVSSCAPSVAPTQESSAPLPIEEPQAVPTQTESGPQPEQPISTAWRAVLDQRYGFGLAVPCWWIVHPIPEGGFGGAMTIYNYNEAYFNAHSTKGFWDWPNGTLKMDVIVMEGIDPANSDIDGYKQFSDPTMERVDSVESQQFGSHSATVASLTSVDNPISPITIVYFFRLAPDKLLMVNPIPQSIIDTPDFQAILASFVLTPGEQVTLPTITPAPALIDSSCAQ